MANKYFRKELFSSVFIVAGAPVPFEQLDGNRGVIKLDEEKDASLIAALNEAADRRRGGIVKITEQEYTEKKSLHPLKASVQPSQKLRVVPPVVQPKRTPVPKNQLPSGNAAGAVAVESSQGQIPLPKPVSMEELGKSETTPAPFRPAMAKKPPTPQSAPQ